MKQAQVIEYVPAEIKNSNIGSKKARRMRTFIVVCRQIVMVLITVFMLFPLIWAVLTSIKPENLIYTYPPVFLTDKFTLVNYIYAFTTQKLPRHILNTIIVATVATALGVIFATLAAFVFSRYQFKGKNFFLIMVICPMLIPGITNLIPLYTVYSRIGLLDTYPGLILLYIPGIMPLAIIVMRNYFDSIPQALEEAAMIDGCNHVNVIWKVVIPVVAPGILAVSIISFITVWNEFIMTLIFTSKSEMRTLTIAMYNLIGFTSVKYGAINAVAFTSVLPVLIIFLIFRKQFINSMLEGAIKG